jgi:UDP-glucose 4-epimerase
MSRAEWIFTDLCSPDTNWMRLIDGCSVVYHLAWTTLPATSNLDPRRDAQDNLLPGLGLLEEARSIPGVRIVFVSSGGTVYGRVSTALPIAEDHLTAPLCAYGLSKLTMENYLALFGRLYNLDYRVLRVANPFGLGQDGLGRQGAVSTFLRRAMAELPVQIWGDGSIVRDYIHVSDVVSALIRAGDVDSLTLGRHRVFNVGSGEGRTLLDIIDALRRVGLPVLTNYLPGRSFDVPINVLDTTHARLILKWTPLLGFDEGVARVAREHGWVSSGFQRATALGSSQPRLAPVI